MRTGTRKGRFNELSNYERKLIAIIIGISAKNAFLPEFPLFIIDEPLDSADDRRFEKTLEYIKQKVKVLIVTKPVFDENTKILTQSNISYA
jgi:enolase